MVHEQHRYGNIYRLFQKDVPSIPFPISYIQQYTGNDPWHMPCTLSRSDYEHIVSEKYVLTEKTDGQRYMCLVLREETFPRWFADTQRLSLQESCRYESYYSRILEYGPTDAHVNMPEANTLCERLEGGTRILKRRLGWIQPHDNRVTLAAEYIIAY